METPTWTPDSVPPQEPPPEAPKATAVAPAIRPGVSAPRGRSSAGNAILVLAAIVAVGGVAFAGGRLTAPASTARTGLGNGALSGQGGQAGTAAGSNGQGAGAGFLGGAGGALTINGTVAKIAAGVITLTLESGSTIDIATTDTTKYHAQAAASASDVTVGSKVAVEVSGFRGGARSATASGAPAVPAGSPAPNASGRPDRGQFSPGPAVSVTITSP
jgi:hypothetical protein